MKISKTKLSAVRVAYDKALKFDSFFATEQAFEVAKNLLTFDEAMKAMFGIDLKEAESYDAAKIAVLESYILEIRKERQ